MTAQADAITTTIQVGLDPQGVAINPAGTFAYVANKGSNSVSKIDLDTNTEALAITVGSNPTDVAINRTGTFAWVTNSGSNSVSKIETASDSVTATILVGAQPRYIAIDPAGTFAWVTNSGSNSVSKIETASDSVTATISVGLWPQVGAINPAGTYIYVTNYTSRTVSKIDTASDTVAATISVGSGPSDVAINPAGTFAYVVNTTSGTVSKIALTATDPQSISFVGIGKSIIPAPLNQLLGVKTVALSATASSTLAVAFTSATATVCTVSGSTVTMLTIGDCTINANQSGGSGFDAAPQVSQTFTILSSPPPGETGVSIKNGASYVNTKQVTLNLIWPEYATAARISNDGGFAASKTQTKDLAASIDWELDDSVQGIYTKVVYVRFNGVADTTKTYSDDIILDTSPPVVESSSAAAVSGSIDLTLKATDDITGVDKVQIKNGSTTVTKDYATKVSVPLADLLLSVSSMGVQKLAATSVEIRVSDKAGNWSAYTPLSVSSVVATPTANTPTVSRSKSATAKSIAIFAKIPVLSTSKVSIKVASGYAKFCKVYGTTLKGIKAGTCKVTVTVTPKKGKAIPRTVILKVTN